MPHQIGGRRERGFARQAIKLGAQGVKLRVEWREGVRIHGVVPGEAARSGNMVPGHMIAEQAFAGLTWSLRN